jgi:hypothetical protein
MLNDANKGALDAYSYPEADGVVAGEDWGRIRAEFRRYRRSPAQGDLQIGSIGNDSARFLVLECSPHLGEAPEPHHGPSVGLHRRLAGEVSDSDPGVWRKWREIEGLREIVVRCRRSSTPRRSSRWFYSPRRALKRWHDLGDGRDANGDVGRLLARILAV